MEGHQKLEKEKEKEREKWTGKREMEIMEEMKMKMIEKIGKER